MSIRSKIFRIISGGYLNSVEKSKKDPVSIQNKLFSNLIKSGLKSGFFKDHAINKPISVKEYQNRVPLRDYNQFESYFERIRKGEQYLLWDKPVKWFAKSSGTSSSKSKYIPVTSDSLNDCHYLGMKKMLASYLVNYPNSSLFDGDALTLGGSVTVDELGNGKTYCGDLSAILLKQSPFWVDFRRVPKLETALLTDFEKKVEEICKVSHKYDITSISGVPSWNLVMLKKVLEYSGKNNLLEIWPNLELFMHGGINFEPYKGEFHKLIPSDSMNYMENYNASEGYFAFQDTHDDNSMLLLTDNGVFYEFIPMERLEEAISGSFTGFDTIESVKKNINYAMVITTNGGLWRYLIGDCIKFTSLFPHKILIIGRTQLFINAFGEELMIHNAEKALAATCEKHKVYVSNYTVAPKFMEDDKKGAHQWLIEFESIPESIYAFGADLDKELCNLNSDYEAKRNGNITMEAPEIVIIKKGVFYKWMRSRDRLGGQNKVPRLSGSREYAEQILALNNLDR